jgi:hypothetical protein
VGTFRVAVPFACTHTFRDTFRDTFNGTRHCLRDHSV